MFENLPIDVQGKGTGALVQLERTVAAYGFATFDGMSSDEQLIDLGKSFGEIVLHRDADEYGITTVAPRGVNPNLTSQLAFTDQELLPHTDGTAVNTPARFLALYCVVAAQQGGTSSLLDGKGLFEFLQRERPELLRMMMSDRVAIFGSPTAEHFIGPVFSQSEDHTVSIRFRADEYGYYAANVAVHLPYLLGVMDELAVKFDLKVGEGFLINNRRALHARTSFVGYRRPFSQPYNKDAKPQYSKMGL